jgi:hypothetical protein
MGDILQILGSSDFDIVLTFDFSVGNWLRTNDTVPWQVFADIKFGGKTSANQVFQNLKLYGANIPVRLVSFDTEAGTVTFKRYSAANGNTGTYKVWYGIS